MTQTNDKPYYIEGRGIYVPIINKVIDMEDLRDGDFSRFFDWNEALKAAKKAGKELPTKKEMYVILYFIEEINGLLRKNGGSPLSGYYWSSSEYSRALAWLISFTSGNVLGITKLYPGYVRAVSAF